ncbi:MAG: DMT family transporter [Planctomycetota bacterium]|nr:DMT family transporter [Planctomycetota bacterium]
MAFLEDHLGELAALGAAMCWVFTSLSFAAAGRRIGSLAVNFIRIFLALGVLMCINRILFGHFLPPIGERSLVLLAASGFIGLAIGDQFLFTSFVDVGPRIAMLLMTAAPPVAALLAWPLLDEPLGWVPVLGIAVTLIGIAWVVLERPEPTRVRPDVQRHRVRGVIFGALGGVCQAVGLILSKLGMGHIPGADMERIDPWTVTLYRMLFGAVGVSVLVAIARMTRGGKRVEASIEVSAEAPRLPDRGDRRSAGTLAFAMLMVCVGVTFGPVVGVWNSMVAVDRAEAGIAATLMAMTPVFILPFAVWLEKERISWRAAIGALIAVAGVAILALANGGGS